MCASHTLSFPSVRGFERMTICQRANFCRKRFPSASPSKGGFLFLNGSSGLFFVPCCQPSLLLLTTISPRLLPSSTMSACPLSLVRKVPAGRCSAVCSAACDARHPTPNPLTFCTCCYCLAAAQPPCMSANPHGGWRAGSTSASPTTGTRSALTLAPCGSSTTTLCSQEPASGRIPTGTQKSSVTYWTAS